MLVLMDLVMDIISFTIQYGGKINKNMALDCINTHGILIGFILYADD